jgi:hypothetical protein
MTTHFHPAVWACAQAEMWDVREYEYWDEARGSWTPTQPAACTVRGAAKTDS